MTTYIYDSDRAMMVDKATGLPMLNQEERARPLQTPRTFGDYEGYQSPIDGAWIEGRRAREYDMKKHNCVDANDFSSLEKRGLKNERFAKKHGLQDQLK